MTINDRIKMIRKQLQLSQSDFGERIGITESAVSNYENGRRSITEQTKLAILKEYNISKLWLENGEGDMFLPNPSGLIEEFSAQYKLTETEIKILRNYLALSHEQREEFIHLVKRIFGQ